MRWHECSQCKRPKGITHVHELIKFAVIQDFILEPICEHTNMEDMFIIETRVSGRT